MSKISKEQIKQSYNLKCILLQCIHNIPLCKINALFILFANLLFIICANNSEEL